MKAFLIALVALVVISVGANRILVYGDFSAQATTASSGNVRLDESSGAARQRGGGGGGGGAGKAKNQ